MNCFTHEARAAVGVCRSCGKGVCRDCANEQTNGLACRNACESRVALINRIIDRNSDNLQTVNAQRKGQGIFGILFGLVFLVFSYWAYQEISTGLALLAAVLGAALAAHGVVQAFGKRRLMS